MNTKSVIEFERYPKYKRAYIRAFDKMLIERDIKGKDRQWQNGEEVFDWWIGNQKKEIISEGQISIEDIGHGI